MFQTGSLWLSRHSGLLTQLRMAGVEHTEESVKDGVEEDRLQMYLDTQDVMPSFPLLGSSHSSGHSSRGCTPPLTSISWSSSRGSPGRSKHKKNNNKSGSVSPVNIFKHSDGSNGSSKRKKSSKSSSKHGTPDTSLDISQTTNSSVFSPSSQPTTPNTRSIAKTPNSNYPSTSSFASYTSFERKKKKSWMSSALSRTYRQRCDEVRKNFPGLPSSEMLIGDYSCALQKDILVHGRVYITTNYLCFYANIFRWETAVSIAWKEVMQLFLFRKCSSLSVL